MRSFLIMSGVLVLAAVGAVGCGGGGPCADYCAATLECATSGSCELADPGGLQNSCTDACQTGLEAVSDSGDRSALEDCLACIAPLYAKSCELSNEDFLTCQNQCLPAQASLQVWLEAFTAELDKLDPPLCADGTPVGGGNCSLSSSGDLCSVECEAGDLMAGAECDGTSGTFTCQCTVGAQQGKTFASDCEKLDSDVLWQECK